MIEFFKRLLAAFGRRWDAEPAEPFKLGTDLASRLVTAMKRKGYTVETNPGHVNIVYVEGMSPNGTVNDNKPNQFNDSRFVIQFEGSVPKIVGAWEATTEPSGHWTRNPMNSKGAARIKFGQYTAWKVGVHSGSHEALVQRGPVTVCRDLNKDFKRAGDREDAGLFGINMHWGYDLAVDDLGTSSAGCLVGRTKAGHRAFMEIVKADPRYEEDSQFMFTAAILPASEVT